MTSTGEPIRRRILLLGSTGSIGRNVIEVVAHLRATGQAELDIVALVAGSNAEILADQARALGVSRVGIADAAAADTLRDVPHVCAGPDAAAELVDAVARPGDLVVAAMVGAAGIPAALASIRRGCDVALANKETLVAAGALVMPEVRRAGVHLLPIDSEHSGILQCLASGRDPQEVKRIVITASGGPFRTWPAARIDAATVEEALNHPTWDMGPKVTIDSASLMNKAMEIVEAHWLFDLPASQIEVIVHPQSIIHGFVEFVDGSVVAQMGPPDMRTPIQYALTWPRRFDGGAPTMDWPALREMTFEPVDDARFPSVGLASEVIEAGGTAGAVFNAANEAAVEAFLAGHIGFGRIVPLVREALAAAPPAPISDVQDVLRADRAAREFVAAGIDGSGSAAATPDVDASPAYESNRSR